MKHGYGKRDISTRNNVEVELDFTVLCTLNLQKIIHYLSYLE